MIKFSYTVPEDEGCYTAMRSIDMSVDCDANVYEIIEVFSNFLKGSGYSFDGRIELLSKEEAEDEVMLQAMAGNCFNSLSKPDKDGAKGKTKDVEL